MSILVNLFIFLAVVCEILFIVGLVSVAYHLINAIAMLGGNKVGRKKWKR